MLKLKPGPVGDVTFLLKSIALLDVELSGWLNPKLDIDVLLAPAPKAKDGIDISLSFAVSDVAVSDVFSLGLKTRGAD